MAGYTRQSTYTDGDIIDAADSNDEFDQLLAAFNASSGHTHDGTAAEGAAITKLLSNTLTLVQLLQLQILQLPLTVRLMTVY